MNKKIFLLTFILGAITIFSSGENCLADCCEDGKFININPLEYLSCDSSCDEDEDDILDCSEINERKRSGCSSGWHNCNEKFNSGCSGSSCGDTDECCDSAAEACACLCNISYSHSGKTRVTNTCGSFETCEDLDGIDGWSCQENNTSAGCYVGDKHGPSEACRAYWNAYATKEVCQTKYRACGCTCPGGECGGSGGSGSLSTAKPISDVLDDAIDWLLTVASIVSILVVVIGGIVYVGSSGKPETAKTAKSIVNGGILGLIICGLAFSIIKVIDTVLK